MQSWYPTYFLHILCSPLIRPEWTHHHLNSRVLFAVTWTAAVRMIRVSARLLRWGATLVRQSLNSAAHARLNMYTHAASVQPEQKHLSIYSADQTRLI